MRSSGTSTSLRNRNAPQFDAATGGARRSCTPAGSRPGASSTTTRSRSPRRSQTPSCLTPLASVFMSSPAQYEKLGRDWSKFAELPVGHGAVETQIVQAARARRPRAQSRPLGQGADSEMRASGSPSRFPTRTPGSPRSCRASVDWVEAPPPDAIGSACGSRRCRSSRTSIRTCGRTCSASRGGVAISRRPGAQGCEHGHRPRKGLSRCWAACGAGKRHGRCPAIPGSASPAIATSATIRLPPRSSSRKRATTEETGQGEVHHRAVGLGSDAAAADERIHQGKHARRRHRAAGRADP